MRAVRVGAFAACEMAILWQIEKGLGREMADRLGQEVGVVGRFHALGHLGLWLLRRMQDKAFALDEGPLDRHLRAEHVETLAILPSSVEKTAVDADAQIRIL